MLPQRLGGGDRPARYLRALRPEAEDRRTEVAGERFRFLTSPDEPIRVRLDRRRSVSR
jgi:hypothetical protein